MRKKIITVCVEPSVDDMLRALAAVDDRTVSFLANRALKEWFASHPKSAELAVRRKEVV
jgi:hypothetical protein